MSNLIKAVKKTMCRICWGMKVVELPNGDTKECVACKGQGMV